MYTRALDRLFRVRSLVGSIRKAFSPRGLFSTGANGVWYDPSDYGTLFQDSAGTTPVTAVGQPVGLMLDKSKGLVLDKSKGLVLGPELITNAADRDFSSDTGFWGKDPGVTISGGAANYSSVPAGYALYRSAFLPQGYYAVTYTVTSLSSGSVSASLGTNSAPARTSTGTFTDYVYTSSTSSVAVAARSAGTTASIDNISVKALPGNHAFNPSGNSANFPVLSARYNLLTKTDQFDDAVWSKASTTVAQNAILAPDGTLSADKLVEAATPAAHFIASPAVSLASNGSVSGSIYVKAAERTWCVVRFGYQNYGRYVNLSTGAIGSIYSAAPDTFTVDSVGNGWFKVTLSKAVSSGNIGLSVDVATADGTNNYAGDGTSGIYIWGADLRVANDALGQPAYQRVNTATDYDTVGFKPYLAFNGVNQWLQTNSIDFTYGDKMFVCAGVRKLSDAATGMLFETSSSALSGSFSIRVPQGAAARYSYVSTGSSSGQADSPLTFQAPTTNILSGIGDISGDQSILRVNGSQVASSTVDQGTGNYGNYPLYIGSRAGASLWFNGRLYGLVVAGKQASASEIASTETWLNDKTGAYEGTPGAMSLDLNFTGNTYYSRII